MALAASQIALTGLSTYSQYQAQRDQARYQQNVANTNARLAEAQAEDAIVRGDRAADEHRLKVRGLIGRQRAALAAQGIDVASGSALDVQEDTAGRGAMDALTIKNNAWREAYGYRTQAQQYRTQGQFARAAGRSEAASTLLTGGLSAVNAGVGGYDRFQRNKGTRQRWM